MRQQRVINSNRSLNEVIQEITAEYNQHRFVRVWSEAGTNRSTDQNALSHAWYNQISMDLAEQTPEEVKCECKLRFGVPILRAEDPDFAEMYDASIKRHLTYEQKLKAMRFLPVTSLMTKDQISRYLQVIQYQFAQRGVNLEFPDEREAA